MRKEYDKNDARRYWDFSKLEAAPAYRVETDERCQYPGMQAIVYEGVMEKGAKTQVFAYIAYPEGPAPEGGFPGIVLVHGGGGTAFAAAAELWVSYGYAVIAPDWYGEKPLTATWEKGQFFLNRLQGPGEPLASNRSKAAYRYTEPTHINTVANLVLAHSLLLSLPKINKAKTMYVGLSWGSWYGAMVAAVDPRFQGVLEIYLGGRFTNRKFINGRFLDQAKSPVFYVTGTTDLHGSPDSMQAGYEACGKMLGGRTLIINLPHSHIGFVFGACRRYADSVLQGKTGLPVLGKTSVKGRTLSAKVKSEGAGIKKCYLCYTTDRKEPLWHKRQWQMTEATYSNGTIKATLPPDVLQCYLAAYDEEDLESYCCGTGDVITL